MPSPLVTFRASDGLDAKIIDRAGSRPIGWLAQRDLERYYDQIARALRSVELSEAEASLLCDACNGTLWEPHTVDLLWAEIDGAIRHAGLDRKWDVDGADLVRRLRDDLTPFERLAVIDAIERFWQAPHEPRRLLTVGLVREGEGR